ncbi:AI-2E family transporter [Salinibacillus aidingensis]|uniref:AI-2E family transporter n=1 Tax=Salinibacillus aidingensis TaxID=237684 RepID=A0ABN1AT77_9BACI
MTNREKRLLYILGIAVIVSILFYLLLKTYPFYQFAFSFLMTILTPILIAAIIAYLLYPLINWLDGFMPRWTAILVIYIVIFGGIGAAIYKAIPTFVKQLKGLIHSLPQLFDTYQEWIYNLYVSTSEFPEDVHDKMDEAFLKLEEGLIDLLTNIAYSLTGITDVIVMIAVIPILVFYFLKDFPKFRASFLAIGPENKKGHYQSVLKDIDRNLGGYLRGQFLVCLFVGVISFLLMWLINMKYPLLLGTFMGITNIIPYFGPVLGAIPAVLIAFTISANKVLYVILAVVSVQLIEGNLLSPYIVGRSLHVHPVLIILALLIGGESFGIAGMILAVPVLTVIKVFAEPTPIVKNMKEAWRSKKANR